MVKETAALILDGELSGELSENVKNKIAKELKKNVGYDKNKIFKTPLKPIDKTIMRRQELLTSWLYDSENYPLGYPTVSVKEAENQFYTTIFEFKRTRDDKDTERWITTNKNRIDKNLQTSNVIKILDCCYVLSMLHQNRCISTDMKNKDINACSAVKLFYNFMVNSAIDELDVIDVAKKNLEFQIKYPQEFTQIVDYYTMVLKKEQLSDCSITILTHGNNFTIHEFKNQWIHDVIFDTSMYDSKYRMYEKWGRYCYSAHAYDMDGCSYLYRNNPYFRYTILREINERIGCRPDSGIDDPDWFVRNNLLVELLNSYNGVGKKFFDDIEYIKDPNPRLLCWDDTTHEVVHIPVFVIHDDAYNCGNGFIPKQDIDLKQYTKDFWDHFGYIHNSSLENIPTNTSGSRWELEIENNMFAFDKNVERKKREDMKHYVR